MINWEEYHAQQQKKEIASIKKRQFVLELSDADVDRLFEKAAEGGMFPEKLLENFIGDLVGGTYSNGSDERELAEQWFERCGFSMMQEYDFSVYLRENLLWNEAVKCLSDIDFAREQVERYSKEIQDGFHVNSYTGEKETCDKWLEERLRRDIHSYGKGMAKLQNDFEKEYWKPYLEHMKEMGMKVTENMESEIKKILEWEKHRECLRRSDEIQKLNGMDVQEPEQEPETDTQEENANDIEHQEQVMTTVRRPHCR